MKILVAPAQFKTCLSADRVAKEIIKGVKKALSDVEIISKPQADGGEGTARIITQACGGSLLKTRVSGPLGNKVSAFFGLINLPLLKTSPPFIFKSPNTVKTAVIEMAAAAGLSQVPENLRNPMNTTTYGVGELILKAAKEGAEQIILGLGDSATNDGGIGALSALGIQFLDRSGNAVKPVGSALKNIYSLKISLKNKDLMKVPIILATDVKNPLLGKDGASRVFAAQKGASTNEVEELEKGLSNLAKVLAKATGKKEESKPGAGAAGGLGFGLSHFFPTTYLSGAFLIQEILEIDQSLNKVQAVFTGEGSFDQKSLKGKAAFLLVKKASQKGIPVFLISGKISLKESELRKLGIKKSISLVSLAQNEKESKEKIKPLLRKAAYLLSLDLLKNKLKNFSKT